MAIEIVDFPIKNGGSFHGKMLVHQRVWLLDDQDVLSISQVWRISTLPHYATVPRRRFTWWS